MHSNNENIEKLFSRKLSKYSVEASEGEWAKLDSKLRYFNFLKWSFSSFNIYYLSVILALAGTTTFVTVKNIELAQKIRSLEQSVANQVSTNQILPKEILSDSISVPAPSAENGQAAKTTNAKIISKEVPLVPAKKSQDTEIKPQINNTVQIKPDTSTKAAIVINKLDTAKVVPVKKVKKTVVIKPAKVIIKDTVVIHKLVK